MTTAYSRRLTEAIAFCPNHVGVGFPAYHIGYTGQEGARERLFECSICFHEFPESKAKECDPQ